jgi:hypothetical protein
MSPAPAGIVLDGVVHLVRPSGYVATSVTGLHAGVTLASPGTLLYHVFHPLLRQPEAAEPPPDDFSAWLEGVAMAPGVAEQVSWALRASEPGVDALRAALLAVLATAPARGHGMQAGGAESAFVFLELDVVPLPGDEEAADGDELVRQLAASPWNVLFHELVERPWLEPGPPRLPAWVRACGDEKLASWIEECARGGRTLAGARRWLLRRWRQRGIARRVAAAAALPESEKRADALRAVGGLVRRIQGG